MALQSDLSGKVAIVTGGGKGIGLAAAQALSAAGAKVVVVDRDAAAGRAAARLIGDSGGNATAIVCDIGDTQASRKAIADTVTAHGRIDILVNNASLGGGGTFETIREDEFDKLFAVDVRGAFFLTQAAVPTMKRQKFGRIINIASLLAVKGTPGNPHYAGAKSALLGFMRAWAVELAPFGITVNTVLPALTPTPMTRAVMSDDELLARARVLPMKRLGTPDDIAPLIVYLASPAAGYVSGQAISPNGAEYVGPI